MVAGGSAGVIEKKTHALLNLHLQQQLVRGLRVFATVENVLDYRFQRPGLGPTYFARGRTFLVGLAAEL